MNKKLQKKILLLGVVAGLAVLYFALDLGQYLTLDYLKESRVRFAGYYAEHPFLVLGAYFLIYVAATGLSLPGAVVMTLAGGALFGVAAGTVVISFASSLGAALACLAARYILRDWVQRRFGEKLGAVNRGVEREGAFYLFTLRLVPIFPFFMINLVMGLTPMRLWTFYWVSQVGMLPGTIVYVNAGSQLAGIDSLSGILSPGLLVSFVLLGLFPLAAKKALDWYRTRTGRAGLEGKGPAGTERR